MKEYHKHSHSSDRQDLSGHTDTSLSETSPYAPNHAVLTARLNQLRRMLYNVLPDMQKVNVAREKYMLHPFDRETFLLSNYETQAFLKAVDIVSNYSLKRLMALYALNWTQTIVCAMTLCGLQNHSIMLLTGMKEDYIKKVKWRLKHEVFGLPKDRCLYNFLIDFQDSDIGMG